MPYYKWTAIDIDGVIHRGKLFAQSVRTLELNLIEQELGIMRVQVIASRSWVSRISRTRKAAFFEQLAQLLQAGLLVPQALQLMRNKGFGLLCGVVDELCRSVDRGGSLKTSIAAFPEVFDPLTIYLIQAGQQAGCLGETVEQLACYLRARVLFYHSLRKALMMPLLTLVFFVAVIALMILLLIPSFEQVFAISGAQPPWYTAVLFQAAHLLGRVETLLVIVGLAVCAIALVRILKLKRLREFRSQWALRLPICAAVVRTFSYSYFFQALGALIRGGVQVVDALGIAAQSLSNTCICDRVLLVQSYLQAGHTLSDSLHKSFGSALDEEVMALIGVGEQTGELASICDQLGQQYFDRGQRILTTLVVAVQPTLLLLLGASIALLIVAIYVPLLQMPDVVGGKFALS